MLRGPKYWKIEVVVPEEERRIILDYGMFS